MHFCTKVARYPVGTKNGPQCSAEGGRGLGLDKAHSRIWNQLLLEPNLNLGGGGESRKGIRKLCLFFSRIFLFGTPLVTLSFFLPPFLFAVPQVLHRGPLRYKWRALDAWFSIGYATMQIRCRCCIGTHGEQRAGDWLLFWRCRVHELEIVGRPIVSANWNGLIAKWAFLNLI